MSDVVGLVGRVGTELSVSSALPQVDFVSSCECGHEFNVLLDGVVVAQVSEDVWSDKVCWDAVIGQEVKSFSTKEAAFDYVREQLSDARQQAQKELEQYIDQQAQELAPEFEVDSEKDEDFGEFFRVWRGCQFVGSFYQSLDGGWIAQPVGGVFSPKLKSDEQAQLVIIAFYYGRQSA